MAHVSAIVAMPIMPSAVFFVFVVPRFVICSHVDADSLALVISRLASHVSVSLRCANGILGLDAVRSHSRYVFSRMIVIERYPAVGIPMMVVGLLEFSSYVQH